MLADSLVCKMYNMIIAEKYFSDVCGGFNSFCKVWSALSIFKVDQGIKFEAPQWHYWHLSKLQTWHIRLTFRAYSRK